MIGHMYKGREQWYTHPWTCATHLRICWPSRDSETWQSGGERGFIYCLSFKVWETNSKTVWNCRELSQIKLFHKEKIGEYILPGFEIILKLWLPSQYSTIMKHNFDLNLHIEGYKEAQQNNYITSIELYKRL